MSKTPEERREIYRGKDTDTIRDELRSGVQVASREAGLAVLAERRESEAAAQRTKDTRAYFLSKWGLIGSLVIAGLGILFNVLTKVEDDHTALIDSPDARVRALEAVEQSPADSP